MTHGADCMHSTGITAVTIAANGTEYNEFPEYFVEAPAFVREAVPPPPLLPASGTVYSARRRLRLCCVRPTAVSMRCARFCRMW